jgi:hypothetical protein
MKIRSGTIFSLSAVAVACFAVSASAIPIGNIVDNGGFETGGLPPWRTSGNTGGGSRTNAANNGAFGVDQDSAHSGNFGAFAGPVGKIGFLTQMLHTQRGSTYDLSFWMEGSQTDALIRGLAHPVKFEVIWNGSIIYQTFTAPTSYTQFTFTDLLATSNCTRLKFGFRDDSGFFHLDDISVGIPRVPEAFSTLWLGLPLLILLLGGRKRIRFATVSH